MLVSESKIRELVRLALFKESFLSAKVDYLNSIIENIMLNQPVPIGTGLPDLVAKMKIAKAKK